MLSIKNFRIGQSIVFFDAETKQIYNAKIVVIKLTNYDYGFFNDGVFEIVYVSEDHCFNGNITCRLEEYKSAGHLGKYKTFWCFPENERFIKHVKNVWYPAPIKKEKDHKYDNYDHDNNKRQLEERLKPQREAVTKIIENGYVWYSTYSGTNKIAWHKLENPVIKYDKDKKVYIIGTPTHYIKLTKLGKVLSIEDPKNYLIYR